MKAGTLVDLEGQSALIREWTSCVLQSCLVAWGLGRLGRSFRLLSGTKGQNVAILGEWERTQSRCKWRLLFPLTWGTCFLLARRDSSTCLIFSWLWSLFRTFMDILLQTFYDSIQTHTRRNVFMKCSLPFHFAFKIKPSEHFTGINSVDNVTLNLSFLWRIVHSWYFHNCRFGSFLYSFCNPKNILLDLHRSPTEFETKK